MSIKDKMQKLNDFALEKSEDTLKKKTTARGLVDEFSTPSSIVFLLLSKMVIDIVFVSVYGSWEYIPPYVCIQFLGLLAVWILLRFNDNKREIAIVDKIIVERRKEDYHKKTSTTSTVLP